MKEIERKAKKAMIEHEKKGRKKMNDLCQFFIRQ